MAFDDIKDKIVEGFSQTKDRFIENPHVQTIKEKYETLPARTQQIVLAVIGFCFVAFLLYIPYSFLSSSSANIADFEKHRNLTRDIFKYSQLPSGKKALPTSENIGRITTEVRSSLGKFKLLPTQIVSIEETQVKDTGKALVKKPILQAAVKASFKQLNLKQVVDLSFHFKNFKENMKLIGSSIIEDTEKKQYFNAEYKLVSYSYPVKKVAIDKGKKKKGKKRKKKKKKKKKKSRK